MTDKERHKRMSERDKERGIVSARVRIPKADLEALRAFARDRRFAALKTNNQSSV